MEEVELQRKEWIPAEETHPEDVEKGIARKGKGPDTEEEEAIPPPQLISSSTEQLLNPTESGQRAPVPSARGSPSTIQRSNKKKRK